MIFAPEKAKTWGPLLHPDVEYALIDMLDYMLEQEMAQLGNESLTMEQLKILQGRFMLLKELKQYKERISDAIESDKW
jgi:uncharacterized protein (DUF486 family)